MRSDLPFIYLCFIQSQLIFNFEKLEPQNFELQYCSSSYV